METDTKYALMPVGAVGTAVRPAIDPSASPFKVVVDPQMRAGLKKALFDLIDHHDEVLAAYVSQGKLSLESYKEYIELFARACVKRWKAREGVLYLLRAAGLEGVDGRRRQPRAGMALEISVSRRRTARQDRGRRHRDTPPQQRTRAGPFVLDEIGERHDDQRSQRHDGQHDGAGRGRQRPLVATDADRRAGQAVGDDPRPGELPAWQRRLSGAGPWLREQVGSGHDHQTAEGALVRGGAAVHRPGRRLGEGITPCG